MIIFNNIILHQTKYDSSIYKIFILFELQIKQDTISFSRELNEVSNSSLLFKETFYLRRDFANRFNFLLLLDFFLFQLYNR